MEELLLTTWGYSFYHYLTTNELKLQFVFELKYKDPISVLQAASSRLIPSIFWAEYGPVPSERVPHMARWQCGWRVTTLQELLFSRGFGRWISKRRPSFSHRFPTNVQREDSLAPSNLRIKHRHDWKPLRSMRCVVHAASILFAILSGTIGPTNRKNKNHGNLLMCTNLEASTVCYRRVLSEICLFSALWLFYPLISTQKQQQGLEKQLIT